MATTISNIMRKPTQLLTFTLFVVTLFSLLGATSAQSLPCPTANDAGTINLPSGASVLQACNKPTTKLTITADPAATSLEISWPMIIGSIEFSGAFKTGFTLTIKGTETDPIRISDAGTTGIQFSDVNVENAVVKIEHVSFSRGSTPDAVGISFRGSSSRFRGLRMTAKFLNVQFCSAAVACEADTHALLNASFGLYQAAFIQSSLTISSSTFTAYSNEAALLRLREGDMDFTSKIEFEDVNATIRAKSDAYVLDMQDFRLRNQGVFSFANVIANVSSKEGNCRGFSFSGSSKDGRRALTGSTFEVSDSQITCSGGPLKTSFGVEFKDSIFERSQFTLESSAFEVHLSEHIWNPGEARLSLLESGGGELTELILALQQVTATIRGPEPHGIRITGAKLSQLSLGVSATAISVVRRCVNAASATTCVSTGSYQAVILSKSFIEASVATIDDTTVFIDTSNGGGSSCGIVFEDLWETAIPFIPLQPLRVSIRDSAFTCTGTEIVFIRNDAHLPNSTLQVKDATMQANGESTTSCKGYASTNSGFQRTDVLGVTMTATRECETIAIADVRLNGTTAAASRRLTVSDFSASGLPSSSVGLQLSYLSEDTTIPVDATVSGTVTFSRAATDVVRILSPTGGIPLKSTLSINFLDAILQKATFEPVSFAFDTGAPVSTFLSTEVAPFVQLQCTFRELLRLAPEEVNRLLPAGSVVYGPKTIREQRAICPDSNTVTPSASVGVTPSPEPTPSTTVLPTPPITPTELPPRTTTPSRLPTPTVSQGETPSLSSTVNIPRQTCTELTVTTQLVGAADALNVTAERAFAVQRLAFDQRSLAHKEGVIPPEPFAPVIAEVNATTGTNAGESATTNPVMTIPWSLVQSGFMVRIIVSGRFEFGGAAFAARWKPDLVNKYVRSKCDHVNADSGTCSSTISDAELALSFPVGTPNTIVAVVPPAPRFVDGGDMLIQITADAVTCGIPQGPSITLRYEPEPVENAVGAAAADGILGAGIVSSAAAPGVAMDAQALAVFSLISCSSRGSRYTMQRTRFLLAPYSFGPEPEGLIIFNLTCLTVFFFLQMSFAALLKMNNWRGVTDWDSAFAQARFPSVFFAASVLVQQGNAILALRLVIDGIHRISAYLALGYSIGFPIVIFFLYRHVTRGDLTDPTGSRLTFFRYEPTVASNWPTRYCFPFLKWLIVPCGRWGPLPMRQRYGSVVANLTPIWLRFAGLPLLQANVVALVAAVRGNSKWQCGLQYGVLIAMYFAIFVTVLIVKPYRSAFENFTGAMSQLLLAAILVAALLLALDPTSSVGLAGQTYLMLLQMMFSFVRTIYMISIRVLERIFWRTESGKVVWNNSRDSFATRETFRRILDLQEEGKLDREISTDEEMSRTTTRTPSELEVALLDGECPKTIKA